MRKVILSLIACILMSSFVLAQVQQGIHEPGTGIDDPELREAAQGTGQGLSNETQTATTTQQQNMGEEAQLLNQVQSRVRSGEYTSENGKQIQIQIQEQSNNRIQLRSGSVNAQTSMEMTQEQVQERTRLEVKLSNGKGSEVKIMPDTASERAMERLRMKVCSADNNCSIELKEVGTGQNIKAAYEVQAQKQAKVLGLFKTKMQVQAQVDAETGEVIQSKKPWWAFLASESEE